MEHELSVDPRRRFALGITIENSNTRLWLALRAGVIVTDDFNFITQPELLIKIFASFAFADEHELGWDPTLRPCLEDGRIAYDIDVNDLTGLRTFRTIAMLADHATAAICGRGTRVFTARELTQPDIICVLKPVWQNICHREEGATLKDVRNELKGDRL
ncbi:hypothetical protein BV25DRAFT_1954513 [Artomyces pyxidatus]|uniref:Uncharacterized protein n=1 Tax=Artomyces pyxidatus TaxID=48021 RepID=A0ACB8SWZ5_9AGAM|nr:hypothetical protein BV25DRAFT_1954513 [Artomyces pyxidatus]